MKRLFIICALALSLTANAATIRALSCEKGHVRVGESKINVLDRCGKPAMTEVLSGDNYTKVEQLVYKFNRMTYAVIISGGKVAKISIVN